MATHRLGVAIAGGGYSGLACAHRLRQLGMNDFGIFEPRDRPGGRAFSDATLLPGRTVDRGAEFFGSNQEAVLDLCDHYGVERVLMLNYEGPYSPILLGCGLRPEDCRAAEREMDLIAVQLVDLARKINLGRPWETANAVGLDNLSLGNWLDQQPLSDLARRAFEAQVVANHGVDLHRLSLLGFLVLIKAHGLDDYLKSTELYRLKGGAQQLAVRMAESMGEQMFYGTTIAEVENGEDEVVIRTANGDTYIADYLVFTVPPSVWPTIRFTPAIPPGLVMQMGMNVKLFAVLSGREDFQAGLNPHSFMRDGLLQLIWETTEGQDGDDMVITAFSGGQQALDLCKLSAAERRELVLRELAECIPGLEPRLKEVCFTGWPKDPFTRAGYSAPAPGQITTVLPLLEKGLGRTKLGGEYRARKWAFVCGAIECGDLLGSEVHGLRTGNPFDIAAIYN